ncbi:MAG: MBL fold metallo-hydrolase [Chlamydiae bacterium]|nr:MBL fold metallo-hydrolase [Chlamydiota bacterium]
MIGCKCDVCLSNSKYNKRLRPSVLIKANNKNLLIDVGPDIREQALKANIDTLDCLLLSHVHYDHIAGIDDLRVFYVNTSKPVDCFLSEESLEELKIKYNYLFRPVGPVSTLCAQFNFHVLAGHKGKDSFEGIDFNYMSYFQYSTKVNGFRFKDLAYLTDVADFDQEIFDSLKDLDTLVISALRYEVSPVHLNFEQAILFAKKTQAKRVFFTHIAHEVDHDKASKDLPKNMQLAYDGLEIDFNL